MNQPLTPLAWRILHYLIEAWEKEPGSYRATWVMCDELEIPPIRVQVPRTESDHAIDSLVAAGLIRELPDLHHRYQIVVERG